MFPVRKQIAKQRAPAHTNVGRSGKDGNSILGSIHSFDPRLGCNAATFQPCSDRALANHKAVTDYFRGWPINSGVRAGSAVAVGRYIEDVYYGGNAWYLLTLAAAEQLYDSLAVWCDQGSVNVTRTSLAFFSDLVPNIKEGTHKEGSETYASILQSVMPYADGYVEIVKNHMLHNGSMPEQFSKNDGSPLGARDLTWSYAALLTASAARSRIRARTSGWLASAPILPPSCAASSVQGAYVSATPTFPRGQTPGGSETLTSDVPEPTPTACLHRVTFNARVRTNWGDDVNVLGSIPELGSWNQADARPLSADAYTEEDPLWRGTISVPAGVKFLYRFVKVTGGRVTEEGGQVRSYAAGGGCGSKGETGGQWQVDTPVYIATQVQAVLDDT